MPARARAQSVEEAVFKVLLETATRTLLNVVIPEPVTVAQPTPTRPKPHVELSDWVDPSSHSTARVGRACGQRYVAYLTGTRALNYLEVKLFNDSDSKVVINARSPVFEQVFRRRGRAQYGFRGMPVAVAEHSGKLLLLQLEKARFYELRRFDVELSVSFSDGRTCPIKVEFSRSLPAAPATFRALSKFDFGTSYGVQFRSGSLRDAAGQVGSSAALFLEWYPEVQHGVRFELVTDSLDSHDYAGALLMLPSYGYRIFFTPRLSYEFGIGAGAYMFTAYANMPGSATRWALLVSERMQLKFEISPNLKAVNLALSPTLTFGVLPGGPFGPRELSGALYTGTVALILGM